MRPFHSSPRSPSMSNLGPRIVAIGLLISLWVATVGGTRHQPQTVETDAESAVAQLRSADQEIQANAKRKLIQLGPAATPSLLKALRDVVNQQNRAYLPDEYERVWSLRRMQILVYELLGRLKVAEAVPLLIQAIETRAQDSGSEGCFPDIEALAMIGEPSVLPLIRSLENAEATYHRNKKLVILPVSVTAIQVRAAGALGDIGDKAALPALEKADNEVRDVSIWHSLQYLKKKNGLRYERWPNGREPERFCQRTQAHD